MWTVYKIDCIANGRYYIGRTRNFDQRKTIHAQLLMCGKHECRELQQDFIKYSEHGFEINILHEKLDADFALVYEWKYIIEGLNDNKLIYNKNLPKAKVLSTESIAMVWDLLQEVGLRQLLK